MFRRFSTALTAVAAVVAATVGVAQPAQAATGFSISSGSLLDANGQKFVMRGISHPFNWFRSQNSSFANIKATGANTVRVVLNTGANGTVQSTAADVANVVSLCKTNKLVCVLEVHDTTGLGDQTAITLSQAADYWIRVRNSVIGQERFVIINIGNEPVGNNNVARWTADTEGAIQKLRSNGFTHTLMVDGPNWGQDWTGTMRANAAAVFNADPQRNTLFSVHMYGVYGQAATITSYLNAFVNAKLPLVVGEFGNMHSDGDVDEDTIMARCQAQQIGYLGWSWSGNGSPVQYLDMTNNFNPNSLTTWGQRIINGANGIRATSHQASIF